ncbi:flagellar biosynthesis protein FlhB [Acuticoccus sp. I52.16.1]|uniref:flagellar biosynthesis protein FlhB n=1 Tax=Acuticoccus sp. I52.16.1 TaxID=2928472 RepID=UPI001FD212AD|nr:flagellar biosynthesis protein FlhB [Acuticoccus sp. I52.16.1]UOM34310.1 flagellar biosynthesis protein FlhB [Acuticoccus sp. I52.16.1]
MADQPDSSEKTEDATPKKIEDSLKKGQTPFSKEAPAFASLLGILTVLGVMVSDQTRDLMAAMSRLMDNAASYDLGQGADVTALFLDVYRSAAIFVLPIVTLLAVFGLAAGFAQSSPRIVGERVRPKLERISIKSGAKRIFGSQSVVEFLRSLFKFAMIGSIAFLLLRSEVPMVIRAVFVDPTLLPSQILSISIRLLSTICAATIILVAADLTWTRMKWRRDLKMTRREVKDELKQSEGDPILKARMRSAQKDRSRRRMLTAVPQSTVVIANPTHYAVALAYQRAAGGAPKVVAKGVDAVALKIRELAEGAEVPVVENPPLARALYYAVEVDRFIPEDFYRAVAQVLYYIYSKDGDAAAAARPAF